MHLEYTGVPIYIYFYKKDTSMCVWVTIPMTDFWEYPTDGKCIEGTCCGEVHHA